MAHTFFAFSCASSFPELMTDSAGGEGARELGRVDCAYSVSDIAYVLGVDEDDMAVGEQL